MVFTMNEVEKLKELKQKFAGKEIHGENVKDIYFDMDNELLVVISEQLDTILELDCSARGKMKALKKLEKFLNECKESQ